MTWWVAYQTTHNKDEKWRYCTLDASQAIKENQATHITPLAFDINPMASDIDWNQAKYKGPMVLDLDYSDLSEACEAAKRVLTYLEDLGVNLLVLGLYASGQKGFHIEIPQKVLTASRSLVGLPHAYKVMAKEIEQGAQVELDMAMYNGKTGHLIRVENKERPDGAYKVPLTLQDVRGLTPEIYRHMVRSPRQVRFEEAVPNDLCPRLAGLFDDAAQTAKSLRASQAQSVPLEWLEDLEDAAPQCVVWLSEGIHTTPKGFNTKAMQIASWVKNSAASAETKDTIIRQFARNTDSDRARTPEERVNEVNNRTHYDLQFACHFIKSHLTKSPCEGCPVALRSRDEEQARLDIVRMNGRYFLPGPKRTFIELTNFIFEVDRRMITLEEADYNTYEGYHVNLKMPGSRDVYLYLDKHVFDSNARFKAAIAAAEGATWKGTEVQLQILREFVASDTKETHNVMKVNAVGIHYAPVVGLSDVKEFHFVEKGFSISSSGVRDNYALDARIEDEVTCVEPIGMLAPANPQEHATTVRNLLMINRPEVIAKVVGWGVACWLRQHILASGGEVGFPLLGIYGHFGAGKNGTARVVASLSGGNFWESGGVQAASVTAHPAKLYLATTATQARVVDELNWTKMETKAQIRWLDLLKGTYTNNRASMGIRSMKGAGVVDYLLRAPVIYLATQAADQGELRERTIDVDLQAHDRHADSAEDAAYYYVSNNRRDLYHIAKMLQVEALKMTIPEVKQHLDEFMKLFDKRWPSRSRHNYAVVFLGMYFFRRCLERYGFPPDIMAQIEIAEDALKNHLQQNMDLLAKQKRRTEIINIIYVFSTLANLEEAGQKVLQNGRDYQRIGNTLYFNLQFCLPKYMMYCIRHGITMELSSSSQFMSVARHEPAFLHYGDGPGGSKGKDWVALDVGKLEDRDIDVRLFE